MDNVFNEDSSFKLHRYFKINLFENLTKIIQLNKVEKIHPNGEILTYTGKIKDDNFSEVTISISGRKVMNANIRESSGKLYKISIDGDKFHKLEEIDINNFLDEGGSINFEKSFIDSNELIGEDHLNNKDLRYDSENGYHNFWDVLVVYTANAETREGGTAAMNALIATSISETNTGYENSKIDTRVFLVGTYKQSYTEDNSTGSTVESRALTHLRTDSTLSTLKNDYASDIAVLIYSDEKASACGVGSLMSSATGSFTTGNSVCSRTCCAGYYSFGHEIGHNIGLCHDAPITSTSGDCLYNYSHGYGHSSGFRTVLAYSASCGGGSCRRVNYYSNPDVKYNGFATGTYDINNSARHANTADVISKVANGKIATSATKGFRPAPLLSPLNNATYSSSNVEFTWNDAHTPESSSVNYKFYLCNDENFSKPKCNSQLDSISDTQKLSYNTFIAFTGSSFFLVGFIGLKKNRRNKISSSLIFISFLLIIYSCDNYSIKEDDAEGSALFASSFGDGGYQENVTSKKINVQDIASGTYYWKVITTDNDNSSKSATSYVRKLIIN